MVEKTLRLVCCWAVLGSVVLFSGCASMQEGVAYCISAKGESGLSREGYPQDRMLIWRASLTLDVENVSRAAARVEEIAKQSDGYVENKSDSKMESADLTVRIPVKSLNSSLRSFESLGTVRSRYVSSKDVTENYVDIDARLKTKLALRDRLRLLLEKATDVKDILAIEKELTRLQGDIDSMQARLKTLKKKADFATVDLSLQQRKILGPVGYVLKGAWWLVEKLFVIRK